MRMRWSAGATVIALALSACQIDGEAPTVEGASELSSAARACRTKRGLAPCSAAVEHARAVSAEVLAIKRALVAGRHDFERLPRAQAGDPMSLLRAYLARKHAGDEAILAGYAYEPRLRAIPGDERVAGLFASPDVAIPAAVSAVASWADPALVELVRARLTKLAALGVTFGADGFAQNGCAAATALLVVVDPVARTVDGIDLTPCDE